MRWKDVWVGGLRVGCTNSLPPAVPLNPRLEGAALTEGEGFLVPSDLAPSRLRPDSHAWWFLFVWVVPQPGVLLRVSQPSLPGGLRGRGPSRSPPSLRLPGPAAIFHLSRCVCGGRDKK